VNWAERRVIPTGIDPEADIDTNRFNEGKCDPAGRFLAGTMHVDAGDTHTGNLWVLSPELTVRRLISGVGISNGIVWTRDGCTMYYIDSNQYSVDAYDYDVGSGSISNRRQVLKVDAQWGKPDGMTIDEHDNLWSQQHCNAQLSLSALQLHPTAADASAVLVL
jgi:sugar lactone lactonase YvrE